MHKSITERLSAEDEVADLVSEARERITGDVFYPNQISEPLRRRYLLQSFLISLYAGFGLYVGKVDIPVRARAYTFEGIAAFALAAAMFMAILNMLSVVVDHYDKRDNEHSYEQFARITYILGWVLFLLATILNVLQI